MKSQNAGNTRRSDVLHGLQQRLISHIVEELGGHTDLLTATLIQMDGEKCGAKLSTVYTRIKKIIKLESPMKY
jgi:hypothetical protein